METGSAAVVDDTDAGSSSLGCSARAVATGTAAIGASGVDTGVKGGACAADGTTAPAGGEVSLTGGGRRMPSDPGGSGSASASPVKRCQNVRFFVISAPRCGMVRPPRYTGAGRRSAGRSPAPRLLAPSYCRGGPAPCRALPCAPTPLSPGSPPQIQNTPARPPPPSPTAHTLRRRQRPSRHRPTPA